jgi:hypothetical protein
VGGIDLNQGLRSKTLDSASGSTLNLGLILAWSAQLAVVKVAIPALACVLQESFESWLAGMHACKEDSYADS